VGKKVAEKIKTHVLCSITLFFLFYFILLENLTVYEDTVEPDRPQMSIKYGACALHAG